MDARRLAADYAPPSEVMRPDEIRFYWSGKHKPYPRARYRLTYRISTRTFLLEKFIQLRSGSSKEMKREIIDDDMIDLFRSALLPEQVSLITRLSMSRVA